MTDVKFPDGLIVSGTHPLVVIGPNGVGKTRLGVNITNNNDAERIAALRNVEIADIPLQRLGQATQQVKNALREVLQQHWRQSFELQNLLSEILAEDREKAVTFREQFNQNPSQVPDKGLTDTRLRTIANLWNKHFPNRTIKIDYEPKVERVIDGNAVSYPIAQMSEGERTALYLAARVVSCGSSILLVDEPETFFHPLLARGLWNDLEDLAPTIRFVYITHDIPFALSRRQAQFAIARSESKAELLPNASTLPGELIAQVFGAASFSVTASRLIFCEGQQGSYDIEILSAWHNCPHTAVVAAGGCAAVRECVSVFRSGKVTGGLEAFGYIDRDGWPDSELNSDPFVKALSVYEVEGLLCVRAIFKALATYNGISDADAESRYNTFLTRAKAKFGAILLNKEILTRAKMRAEVTLTALMNPIKPDVDLAKVRANFEAASPAGGWQPFFQQIFQEEEARLAASLSGTQDVFLKDFPAKSYYADAAQIFDMTPDALVRNMSQALKLSDKEADENSKLKALRDGLVAAMEPIMWPRTV